VAGLLKYNNFRSTPLFHYSILLCLAFAVHCLLFTDVSAQSPHDEYKQIQKDLRTQKKKLESTKKVEKSVLGELRKTAAELNEIESQLTSQRKKIRNIQHEIAVLQEDIKTDSALLQSQREHLKKRLRIMQQLNLNNDVLLILISGESIPDAIRTIQYLKSISNHDYGLIKKYKERLLLLTDKEKRFKKLFADLKVEEKKLSKLEGSLKEKKAEKETLLVSVRKEKKTYEKMIKETQEASNRLLRIIQESEKRERELRKKRPPSKPGAKEDGPDDDSGFGKLKGKLFWPVSGSIAIPYGTQVDPLFNLPVFRSGIHIKASAGADVKSVHEGKIVFADDFKGYGQLVIVSHGGSYHTLYGNLSRIFLKNGAIIKGHTAIGEVGESAALGTSGLYFELRYKGKPLDPQQWLKR